MNPSLAKKIIESPHILGHFLGFDRLTPIHSDWIKYCFNNKVDCSLQAHRGSYKTTAVMIIGTIWWLIFNFNDRILLIRKDFTSASDVLTVIGRLMNSPSMHTLFIELYGFDYKLATLRNDKLTWSLKSTETREGNINALGMGQDITGIHADKILCDDIITLKDKLSHAERLKTCELIRELRSNIIDPGRSICFTGTPWHKMDGWSILPEPKKYTIHDTHLAAFTEDHITKLKQTTTPSLYSINYELRHIASDTQMFVDPVFGEWDFRESCYGHIDAKYGGTDTGALTFISKTNNKEYPFQAIGFKFDCHIDDYLDKIIMLFQKYNCIAIYKEKNDDKGYVVKVLQSRGIKAISYHETENKHIKISNFIYPIWKKILWAYDTDLYYLNQIVDYEEGAEPDDAPDSLASLIKYGKYFLPTCEKPSVLSGKKSDNKKKIMELKKEERQERREALKDQFKKIREMNEKYN